MRVQCLEEKELEKKQVPRQMEMQGATSFDLRNIAPFYVTRPVPGQSDEPALVGPFLLGIDLLDVIVA